MDEAGRLAGRRRRRFAYRVIAAIAMVLPVGYVGISILAAHLLTRANNRTIDVDPREVGPGAVDWRARTADGLTLRGWYYPTGERKRLIVLVHGMGGSWGEMAALGSDLRGLGHDVLLFDLRGHGRSDASRLFMGHRERNDLKAVQAWADRQGFPPGRVGWLGYSMGASTLLMEAAENADIRNAVLDSPYGNLPELLGRQLPAHSHLPSLFTPGILVAARLVFGVRTDDLIPIRSARQWGDRPVLLFHGEADSVVPVAQSRRLARVLGPSCRAYVLPGVEHVSAYGRHRDRYVATVDAFFRRNLHGEGAVAGLGPPAETPPAGVAR